MSLRIHRMTHPILGVVSWREIRAEVKKRGRVCSWCFKSVPPGNRTRCGKPKCQEKLWQVQRWQRCVFVKYRANRKAGIAGCELCKNTRCETEIDHIVPVSLGGTGDQSNLRVLCKGCHKRATKSLRRLKAAYKA